jgi:DNA polymerase
MNNKKAYLKEMGIDLWQSKSKKTVADSCSAAVNAGAQVVADWPALERQVVTCTLCALHKTRTNPVFGVGNKNANVMFIGEAPGANEDLQGEPFVGRAGMLLNSMVQSIGLKRSDVYIANILKCRPPNNRDPEAQEVKLCTPYLEQQIALIQPKVLVAVGRIAAQFLLDTTESMSRLHGRTYQYGPQKIPLLVTYHPAYLLRSPSEKRKAYADFLSVEKMIAEVKHY